MFEAWPSDQLFELYTHTRQTQSATGPHVRVAPLSVAPLDGLVRTALGNRMPKPVTDGLNPSVRRTGHVSAATRLRLAVTSANDIGPVLVRGRWLEEIERFRPQVIHSLLGGVRITKFVSALSRRLDVPVVPHFMDDWMDNVFTDGQLGGYARRVAERSIGQVLERSPLILTVGRSMQREYERTLGRPAEVVGNSVDFDAFEDLVTMRQASSDGPITLRYVGGLHLGRADVLRQVGQVLSDQPHATRPWRLALNVPAHDIPRADELAREVSSITNDGSVAPEDVPRTIVGADALLFLESTDPGITSFTRLSVSTKVPEYLASRRPVLAVGPSDQASIATLVRTGAAMFGGNGTSPSVLNDAVAALCQRLEQEPDRQGSTEPALREEFGRPETQERLRRALLRATSS
ncbi:hypothetical protein KMZ32_18450 [Phycicoccus sp. MAQZ13P-2]|uniref:hypothetical protein n=1 Tax=Phycicoccus mangrovi TaxID=2840470 RepID=UPI001C004982|nr:hypothetical protein [Phycicoccus mangrovi]MBT9257620.1 hypothetical protein [Phycicoccus mangrovi]MBT9276059.1 hypothetical protein [Phycicoccus mangrovi]